MESARSIYELAQSLDIALVTRQEPVARWLGISLEEETETSPAFCIVIGGDGTLLTAAKLYAELDVPLLGVNAGHLGFLTEVEVTRIREALASLLRKEYRLDSRSMLEVSIRRKGAELAHYLGLNDVVVTRGTFARIITVDIRISGHHADRYRADGVIVASPTGSTAYSLAAGGPVVDPQAEVLVVTPICPHSLRGRAMVVRDREEVELEVVYAGDEVMLTVDGQVGYPLQPQDQVIVGRSPYSTKLIRLRNRSFYDVIRSHISGTGEEDEGEIQASDDDQKPY